MALIQVLPGLGFSPTLDEDDYIPESVEAVVYGPLESFADDLETDETSNIHLDFAVNASDTTDEYDDDHHPENIDQAYDSIPDTVESDSLSEEEDDENNNNNNNNKEEEAISISLSVDEDVLDSSKGYKNHAALVQAILEETDSTDEEGSVQVEENEQQQQASDSQSVTSPSVRSKNLKPLPSILRTCVNKDQPKSVSFKGVTMHVHAVGLGDCPWVQNGLPTALTFRRLSSKKYASTHVYEREQEERKERRRAKRAASLSPSASPKSITHVPDVDATGKKKKSKNREVAVRRMSSNARRELLRMAGYTDDELVACLEQVYELKKDMLLNRPTIKRKGKARPSSLLQHQDSLEALHWLDCICAAPDQPMVSSSVVIVTD